MAWKRGTFGYPFFFYAFLQGSHSGTVLFSVAGTLETADQPG